MKWDEIEDYQIKWGAIYLFPKEGNDYIMFQSTWIKKRNALISLIEDKLRKKK